MAIHLCTTSRMSSVLSRDTISFLFRCWFRPEGRPTFLARKKVGKETHPAFRGPSGFPRCPNAQQVTSPTRPAGSDSEVTFSADHSGDSARQRDWGAPDGDVTFLASIDPRVASVGRARNPTRMARSAAPSVAPIDERRGRINGLRCLSPRGRVGEARRHRGLAIGDRRQATRPWAVLLCLLSCTSKKVRRPPGRNPANGGSCLNDLTRQFSAESKHHSILVSLLVSPFGATYFLGAQESRQRSASRRRGPSGCPRCPNAQQVTSPTRPAGSDSEVTFSAEHSGNSARQRD